ncbi:acyltransferase family protein [Burkholderia stabilis]|uniref:acyltransferase family protein n=1 Tax=Burkholderia stabilis TaxID=95485 RepID=UPI00158AE74B|nr:acyltransferase [Burkholderia stabilis]
MADQHGKNLEIEALRGISVLMVIVYHSGNLLFWSDKVEKSQLALWGGVDIFFAISGFVIARAFAARLRNAWVAGNFGREAGAFFIRRIFRIIPSAWLWMLVMLALSISFNSTGVFTTPAANISDFIAVALNISNIHFARCLNQTDGALLCGNNGIYWTLSLEEQFYLLFPLIVLLRPKWVVAISASWLVCMQAALIMMNFRAPFLYLIRADAVLLGVCIAYFSVTRMHREIEPKWLHKTGLAMIAAPALIACVAFSSFGVAPIGQPELRPYTMMVSVIGALAVWVASYDRGYLFPANKLRVALAYIGARSFAIYLIHNPVYWATRELWARLLPGTHFDHTHTALFIATAVLLIWLLSELNYRFIEMPLRDLGSHLARRLSRAGSSAIGVSG